MTTHVKSKEHGKPSWNKVVLLTLTLILTLITWACTQCVTGVTRMELVGFDPSETYFQHEHVPLDQVYLRIAFDDQSEHQKYLHDPAIVVRGSILPDLSLDTENVGENFVVHIYYAGFSYHIYYDVISPGIIVRSGESIQAAINASEPGDVILVEAGIYEETLLIPVEKTGITLRSLSGVEETIVKNVDVEVEPVTLRIQANDVTVEGFTFTKDGEKSHQDEVGILLEGVEGVFIKGNRLTGFLDNNVHSGAIKFNAASNNTVIDNLFQDNLVAIYLNKQLSIEETYSSNNLIENNVIKVLSYGIFIRTGVLGETKLNVISFNTFTGSAGGTAIHLDGDGQFIENIVRDNDFAEVTTAIDFSHSVAEPENRNFSNNEIVGNRFSHCDTGVLIFDVKGLNNKISGNQFLDNNFAGIILAGSVFGSFSIENNAFFDNKTGVSIFADIDEELFELSRNLFTLNETPLSFASDSILDANFNYWGSPNDPQDKINIDQGTVVIDTWYIDEDLTTTNQD